MYPTYKEELIKPDWSVDFLRKDPRKNSVECDINYLINQAESQNYFLEWFSNSQNVGFIDILKTQHKIACLGEKQTRKYKTKVFFRSKNNCGNNWQERDSFPGMLRIDLIKENIPHPYIDMLRLSKSEIAYIKNEPYFNNLYCSITNKLDLKKTKIKYGPINIHTIIESTGKQKIKKFMFYKNGYFKLKHPVNDEYILCLKNVEAIMSKLTNLEIIDNCAILLDLLAEYYHNAINWMPFAHVNNSLFMGQANAILRHYNLKSVPHSKMDIYALLTSTRHFKHIFKQHILSYQ